VRIRSLDQANQNTQNDSAMMKTAEGAVSSTVEILKSLKEKAINAANDSNTDADRATIQKEMNQYIDQIDDNALTTFNGKYLVDGSKNFVGNATKAAFTNQSLAEDTVGSTALTALKNRNGESLEIASTDKVTASYVQAGVTYTTTYDVGNTTLEDVFQALNDVGEGPVFGAANLSNSTMSVDEAKGKIARTGTGEDILGKIIKGTATADEKSKYTEAAKVLSENGEIKTSANANVAHLDSVKHAFYGDENVDTDGVAGLIKAQVDGITIKSAAGTTETATVQMMYYDKDGNASTKEYRFTTSAGTTGESLKANDSEKYEQLLNDYYTSTENLARAWTNQKGDAAALTGDKLSTVLSNYLKKPSIDTALAADTTGLNVNKETTAATSGGTDVAANNVALASYATTVSALAVGGSPVESSNQIGLAYSNDMTYTNDKTKGLTITSLEKGISGQIAGVNISISDSEGNVKKTANAALDQFGGTIAARNESVDNALNFHVGAEANVAIKVGLTDMRSEALGLKGFDGTKLSIVTRDKANAAVNVLDNALQKALDQQTTIGAIESRLEYTSSNLTTASENVQASESTIRDADMAKEMTNYTKNNVLLQAAQSMLAQANQNSSAVLSLLQ